MDRQILMAALMILLAAPGCHSVDRLHGTDSSSAIPGVDGMAVELPNDPGGVTLRITSWVQAPPDRVFALINDGDHLKEILVGAGSIAPVAGHRVIQGTWGEVGARRLVLLGDGTSTEEELTAFQQPKLNAYRVYKFNSFASHLLSSAEGSWTYEPDGSGTRVTWTYTFVPSSRLARPLIRNVARGDFREFMETGMGRLKSLSERAAPGVLGVEEPKITLEDRPTALPGAAESGVGRR